MRWCVLALCATTVFAADPDQELAEWQPVHIRYDSAGLSAKQRAEVEALVEASQYLERIYWEQSDPAALKLLQTTEDPKLRRLLTINGGPYDLLDGNKPFVGDEPFRPGRNIYPPGLTREQLEKYVVKHPEQKAAIYNPLTMLRWKGDQLEAVPYHVAYRQYLEPASKALMRAAGLSPDPAFANYLRLRAAALLTDDYYPSDSAWVDLKKPQIDLIYAPYETYLDDVLGVKASWGAAVLIRDDAASGQLSLYEKYVPAIQQALPVGPEDKPSKEGQPTPLEVMRSPFRSGDLRHGYQAVADNLPNDARIHAEKGTKKIFFKDFMDARVEYVILPLAKQVMAPEQAQLASGDGYLAAVVLHEICHGLGPAYSRVSGKRVDIREAIGPIYAALEEAKADVVGIYGLDWLMDHNALPKSKAQEYYASYVAGIFRTVRYGVAEAHGRAEMMEFNYLAENRAIRNERGRYRVVNEQMPEAISKLAKELLAIEATGDRARAEQWFERYDKMPGELSQTLAAVHGVPVDVDPKYDFPELPRQERQ